MTRWVVDAMNVIGSRPDGWWRDRQGAMRSLAERLDAFARQSGEEVTVVLDVALRDPPALTRARILHASTPGRDAADHEIARLVEADEDPASLRVATSDAALAERVRAAGAQVEGAGAFRRRLET